MLAFDAMSASAAKSDIPGRDLLRPKIAEAETPEQKVVADLLARRSRVRKPFGLSAWRANQLKIVAGQSRNEQGESLGRALMDTNREIVLENVRRYRAIASLYRQTAAFRPRQRGSLLDHAQEWENLALTALESYFGPAMPGHGKQSQHAAYAPARWETMAAA